MTNLEFYRDEIIEKLKDGSWFECAVSGARNGAINCNKTCAECLEEGMGWLLEEYKEPIKLKQWEYDLLSIQKSPKDVNTFESFGTYMNMKEKGHFKGITDTSMTLEEILKNCEVTVE